MSSLIELNVHLELKYCERCGALCLRRKGERERLCERCAEFLANPPHPSRRRRDRRAA